MIYSLWISQICTKNLSSTIYTIIYSSLCAVHDTISAHRLNLKPHAQNNICNWCGRSGKNIEYHKFFGNFSSQILLYHCKLCWLMSHTHTQRRNGVKPTWNLDSIFIYSANDTYMFRRYNCSTIFARVKTKAESNLSFQQFGICSLLFHFCSTFDIPFHSIHEFKASIRWLWVSLTSLSAFKIYYHIIW